MKKKKVRKSFSGSCKPPYHISEAGHLLSTKGSRKAGSILSHDGKIAKKKRKARGCLNGPEGTFRLTALQKKNLPKALQVAIIERHRRLGKRILP
ncbi:hypothetical protein ACE38W_00965 [Chitinophaga sp. Hz27]|uniref:hypothetical protein n=1 Tax=Chitinophaga sp. Hz27 TaxID=3347169 RepID=UPI0035DFC646